MSVEKKNKEEAAQGEKPKFTVADKRFWARKDKNVGDDGGVAERKHPSFVEELKAKSEQNEKKLKEYMILYNRLKSENDLFKKRLQKEQEIKVEAEKDKFLVKFLAVVDNLDRALKSTEAKADYDGLLAGIKLVREGFLNCLRGEGIERVDTIGKQFDPKTSEAVEILSLDGPDKDDLVVDEIEGGYVRDGKLLRPAKVRVGKFSGQLGKVDKDKNVPGPARHN